VENDAWPSASSAPTSVRVRRVIESAFGRPLVADLAVALQDSPAGRRGLSQVAEGPLDCVGLRSAP
jgi:hypothetical protein